MKKINMFNKFIIFGFFLISLLITKQALAQDPGCTVALPMCYWARSVEEWACTGQCSGYVYLCAGNGLTCPPPPADGDAYCTTYYPGMGPCILTCNEWSISDPCKVTIGYAACYDRVYCTATYLLSSCFYSGTACTLTQVSQTKGCCGPGGGPTPTPLPPGSTPAAVPSPTPGGPSPTPASIRVRTAQIDPLVTSNCPIPSSALPLPLPGFSSIYLSDGLNLIGPQNIGNSYYTFSLPTGKNYTIYPSSVGNYNPYLYCNINNLISSGTINSGTAPLTSSGLTWDIGFISQLGWFQAIGGNIHANGDLSTDLPPPGPGLHIIETANSDLPAGIVSYTGLTGPGTDAIPGGNGKAYMAKDAVHNLLSSYYGYYNQKVANKTPLSDAILDAMPATGTISDPLIYETTGSLIIQGAAVWNITGSVIIFVNGNLTIEKNIRVAPGNFLAFIVKDNITINGNIGYDPASVPATYTDSAVANITGIFIADGIFNSVEPSGNINNHLLLHGTYVANDFNLTRDMGAISNLTLPAERFVYRADLWRNAPDELKELDLRWQEVAP